MKGREGVSVISHKSVTSSDFINKSKKRPVFCRSVSTLNFLQLAVAMILATKPCWSPYKALTDTYHTVKQ